MASWTSCAALQAPWAQPRPLWGVHKRAGAHGGAAVTTARYGGGRRWWSDAWEDDPKIEFEGAGLDGGLAPAAAEEEATTFFCADGAVVRLGGPLRHPLQTAERRGARRGGTLDPLPLPEEQGLCIGSVFSISATNGIDAARRLHLLGFCFSAEQLYEQVEDCVLRRGGEVHETQRHLSSNVHERLHMSVAIPLLWGVPPEYERLKGGIKAGGGIIDRVEQVWFIF